jgi:hypothetical protein
MARSKKSAQALNIDGTGSSNKASRTPSPSRTRSPLSPESERPVGPLSVAVSSADRDIVKVNNANATELKNACDDAVKRVSIFSFFIVAVYSLRYFPLFLYNNLIPSFSIYLGQSFSSKSTFTPMFAWGWDG